MRLMKIPLFLLMVLVLWASGAQAQIRCTDITPSLIDQVKVAQFRGKPGDTARMPILFDTDSIVTAFEILIKYDTAFLTPVYKRDSICLEKNPVTNACVAWSVDSNFVDYTITSARYPKTVNVIYDENHDTVSADTVYNLLVTDFQGRKDVIACDFLPSGSIDSLPSDGQNTTPLFSVKFIVKELGHANKVFHNATSAVSPYQIQEYFYDTVQGLPESTAVACKRTQASTLWFDSLTFIVNEQVTPPETTYVATSYFIWPTTFGTTFRVDTAYVDAPPLELSIGANPLQVSSGGRSVINWVAQSADSIVVTASPGSYHYVTTVLNANVQSDPLTSTTTFTVTAYQGATQTLARQVIVTVITDPTGDPTITFTPTNTSYTIDQGQTVSFTVTGAAPTTGQQVTLSMISPPNNATFSPTNPVIGTTAVNGTCSFTPDFNQSGVFALTFQASAGGKSTTRSVTVTVNQTARDRLFSVSTPGQKPEGGLRGTPGIKWPINLVTDKTFYGVQFDMAWPYQQVIIDSFTVSGRVPEYVVYDNLNVTPGDVRVLAFGLDNEPVGVDSASGSAIMYAWLTLDSSAVPWTTYWLGLKNGRGSINPNPNFGSVELVTDSGVVECDNPGDVNLDKFIDVADLVNIVAKIVNTFDLTFRQFRTADIITDASINVFDLVADINLIYGLPVNLSPSQPVPEDSAMISLAYENFSSGSTEILAVRSELPTEVAGVQLQVDYDPEVMSLGAPKLTQANEKFTINYKNDGNGRMTVLLYHMKPFRFNELLQAGLADLVEIPMIAKKDVRAGDRSAIRLTEAYLSTATAGEVGVRGVDPELPTSFLLRQNYPNPFNPTTMIEFSVPVSDQVVQKTKLEIFNVLGQHVKTLVDDTRSPGDYKVSWDATSDTGRRVATGLYLYRLQVGDDNQTKKMLFLK